MNYEFNEWLKHENTKIIIEKAVAENSDDAKLRRFKDYILFVLAVMVVACAFIYCSWKLINFPGESWPLAIDSSIISGLLGFLVGKKSA